MTLSARQGRRARDLAGICLLVLTPLSLAAAMTPAELFARVSPSVWRSAA